MSQHLQLIAGSGKVPRDGQHGNVLSGPTCFAPPPGARPASVATVGVEPGSYLRRAILWRAFGAAEVEALDPVKCLAGAPAADALVLQHMAHPPGWTQLLAWIGRRHAIVDVDLAARMLAAEGCQARVSLVCGPASATLAVMCHQQDRLVYPEAPAVEIVAPPPVPTGMAPGDRLHMFCATPTDLGLRVLEDDASLAQCLERSGAVVWGRESRSRGAALIGGPTPGGGWVTIMDLNTVSREPDAAGSQTPAVQVFLSSLGQSPVTFGRFVVPHAHYPDFLDDLAAMAERHKPHASMETIGRSVEGREIKLFKIARRPNLPVILLSNVVHPYEWAPIYGVWRYLRYVLESLDGEGLIPDDLLASHQIWWVPSVCPDGFDNRLQQPSAINLNRNFPGGWEYAAEGQLHWGAYGSPHSIEAVNPISLRGPAPASQPETRAMMALMERRDGAVVTLADFHENVGTSNFLHQYEDEQGRIRHAPYQVELLEGICQAFGGRFFEHRDASFYRVEHRDEFAPGRVAAWLGYAVNKGAKGCVVEASGGDCTHYRTVRRTEYAAQMVEQVLAAERGRLFRNPWGADRNVRLNTRRHPAKAECLLYDASGRCVENTQVANPKSIERTVPAGGCLRLRYDEK